MCVIAASGGYPEAYESGKQITGLDKASESAVVFHAGTRVSEGKLCTSGGRVLGVTATGENLQEARAEAYAAIEAVHFEGMFFRRDIGAKGLPH